MTERTRTKPTSWLSVLGLCVVTAVLAIKVTISIITWTTTDSDPTGMFEPVLKSAPYIGTSTTYLAPRTDGVEGIGTQSDPYDCSTAAKLHAVWDAGVGQTVVFLSGKYYSTNSLECSRKNIFGHGATLYWSNSVSGGAMIIAPVLIEGITLDGGTHVKPNTTCPVGVRAVSKTHVKNVKITKLEGYGRFEGFGVLGFGDFIVVEGCSITDADGPYVSAIAMGNGSGHRIINNFISLGDNNPTNSLWGISTYADNCVVSGNVVRNVSNAVHHDASGARPSDGFWENNLYTGNYLEGSARAIRFDTTSQKYKGWMFVGNTIATGHTQPHVPNEWCDTWIYLKGSTPSNVLNFTFSNNHFIGKGTSGTYNVANNPVGCSGLMLDGNRWDYPPVFTSTNSWIEGDEHSR